MSAILGYADKNYIQKKSIYDALYQAFNDCKYGVIHGDNGRWNVPVEMMQGVTMRLIGPEHFELTCHYYEVCTMEGLARVEDKGYDFIDGVVKEVKKVFKNNTGKAVKIKEIKKDRSLDKVSRLSAESSWMLGSSRYGHGARPVGRFLIRDSKVFDFSASL